MIFENLDDFVAKINPFIFPEERKKYINVVKISDLHANIPKGCGCTRNQRTQAALNAYRSVPKDFTVEEQMWLKSLFNNEEVIFKENNDIFFEIPSKITIFRFSEKKIDFPIF